MDNSPTTRTRPKVVVVGGGFGGVNVSRVLAKSDIDLTIIDRTNHHLFQPLLYQVATGILPEGLIAPALRRVVQKQKNTKVVLGDVVDLDLKARTVSAARAGRSTNNAAVRHLGGGGWCNPCVFRARRLGGIRARNEDAGGCSAPPESHIGCVRNGGAGN